MSDAEAEAAETQVWLEFAVRCGYLKGEVEQKLSISYDNILGKNRSYDQQSKSMVVAWSEKPLITVLRIR